MLWQIIKKQGLLFFRNPQELLLLIALPIILVTILGTALGSFMNSESSPIELKVAFIEHEDEQEQLNRFLADMAEQLPAESVAEIQAEAEQMMPIKLLKEQVFGNEELKNFIKLHEVEPSERNEIIQDDSYTSIIEVPANFTYAVLNNMVLGNEDQPVLTITQNEASQAGASIVDSVLTQFQEQLTLGNFLSKNNMDESVLNIDESMLPGEMTTINEKDPISAKAYYTIGMVVMNVLFLAGSISSFAFEEKRIHVIDRVILGNVPNWVYYSGILASGTIFAFIQSIIVFTFSRIAFGISWPDLPAFLAVTLAFSLAVGGIAVLLSAISYRINSETVTGFFSSILVTLLSVLGGSFFPIGDFSSFIQKLGNLTPNGAGMSAYLAILRGDGFAEIGNHLIYLTSFALFTVIIAALCFPKRSVTT
ncbi:ABC transporter permease [Ornithinibacillus contaminans]|uniref:ABC transporter permease n=1 Tax=Ornithinibacillus contaminans TaxID=694055 RepID=UPI00064DDDE4|nr:ABC transporter permease [Ornithinibacillus contaminans]